MKTTCTLIVTAFLSLGVCAQTIWTGPDINFTRPDGADWTLPANQDRITDNVWITRANIRGIFNIATEDEYVDFVSPADTEWAFGTTTEIDDLTFEPWQTAIQSNPPGMVGQDMVLHLITDDIYIDIRFTSWANGSQGGQGGFSYQRSTEETSAVNDPGSEMALQVYPNPVGEVLHISESVRSRKGVIYDISGRKMMDVETDGTALDINKLIKGIYFLDIEGYQTVKFVKE